MLRVDRLRNCSYCLLINALHNINLSCVRQLKAIQQWLNITIITLLGLERIFT